ncbi:pyrroloquinoline quinone-dependent dehydrogenase [Novosphingobium sp.]|uniref:pyrroloquinoline quinone-dependent dehydrogenase n=1 Tax=Novosphingobium sp. TaxID=1874826 RepID=UPI002603EED5|nr:pyrroloquinoline quinone-dependent dehydrogenase [Novosphingobium sp.]
MFSRCAAALSGLSLLALAACSSNVSPGFMPQKDQDWLVHSGETDGTRYSPLAQINPQNVKGLGVAWTYSTGEMKRRSPGAFARTKDSNIPIKVGNHLLICTPFNRVISINPATGKENWAYEPNVDLAMDSHDRLACRGVAYWQNVKLPKGAVCAERILMNTTDRRLIALDLRDGKPCNEFGVGGTIAIQPDQPLRTKHELSFFMPPVVINDIVVLGSAVEDNGRSNSPSGKIRAFDVRTGALRWEWDMVPRVRTDPAYATWLNDSAARNGSGNAWGFLTADPKRNLVFIPTTSPSLDHWGINRPGDNKDTESIVALDAVTGKKVWAYQTVHHDLWDYDVAPQPLLADLPLNGKTVPALIQHTKQGMIFVLNRETGVPLFPIVEKAVPKGDIPGEWYSPTQPIPTWPKPLRKLSISEDDAWGITPWEKAECRALIRKYRHGDIYIPPSEQGTIVPWWVGGVEWPGAAFDPNRKIMVVNSNRIFGILKLIKLTDLKPGQRKGIGITGATPMAGTPYAIEKQQLVSSSGVPCTKPPFGGLTAIDMTTGKVLWDVPLGSIEKFVPGKPRINMNWWGVPSVGGPVITEGGLVFIAGTLDQRFRAFSVKTGEELWDTVLPAEAQTTPITYSANGRQYVVIVAGGNGQLFNKRGDYVVAYALPQKK